MLTPLRDAHTWLQERTASRSIEDQLQESGLMIESDDSPHDEQDLDESSKATGLNNHLTPTPPRHNTYAGEETLADSRRTHLIYKR